MICQERFSDLPDYPFSRLRTLLDKVNPGETPIDFSVGQPKHSIPPFVSAGMMKNIDSLNFFLQSLHVFVSQNKKNLKSFVLIY